MAKIRYRQPIEYDDVYGRPSVDRNGFYQRGTIDRKKRTGAKMGRTVNGKNAGKPYIRGWNYSRRHGLVSYLCTPYKNTHVTVSEKSGREWENWMCVRSDDAGIQTNHSCLYDVENKKILLPELSMIINPSAPNGGYCGRNYKR